MLGRCLPGARCGLGRRPAARPGLRPAQHPASRSRSRSRLRPRRRHQPWACGCAPWRTPVCKVPGARGLTHLGASSARRAGGARGGGFAGSGRGAWLRLQVRRLRRAGGRGGTRGARAALERVSRAPATCRVRHLPRPPPPRPFRGWSGGSESRARSSRRAGPVALRDSRSPGHNGGLVSGVASWSRQRGFPPGRAGEVGLQGSAPRRPPRARQAPPGPARPACVSAARRPRSVWGEAENRSSRAEPWEATCQARRLPGVSHQLATTPLRPLEGMLFPGQRGLLACHLRLPLTERGDGETKHPWQGVIVPLMLCTGVVAIVSIKPLGKA